MKTKRCTKCGEIKPRTEFAKDRSRKDGLMCWCKACMKAHLAKYYQEHKAEYGARAAKHYQENTEEMGTQQREYNKSPKGRAVQKKYHTSLKGKAVRRAVQHNRRVALADIPLTALVVEEVIIASKGKCPYCGKKIKEGHLDHIVPVSKDGTNNRDNLVYVCASCNQSKGTKDLDVFLKEVGLHA